MEMSIFLKNANASLTLPQLEKAAAFLDLLKKRRKAFMYLSGAAGSSISSVESNTMF